MASDAAGGTPALSTAASSAEAAGAAGRGGTPLGLKLGYATGALVDGVVTNGLNIFLLFYLTVVCGLSGGLAGLALSAGLVVDAVMDPLIGAASDRWRSRLGRRLPFMLVGAPLVAVMFAAIFALPRDLPTPALFAWVAALSILLRIALSLFNLPYQAVGAELTDDYHQRSSLVAWRWAVGVLGALAAVMLGFGVFLAGPAGLTRRDAYPPLAVSLAAIVLLGGALSGVAVWRARARLHAPADAEGAQASFAKVVGEVFRNPSFRVLFAGALLFFVALGVNSALGLHANTYFWRLTAAQTQTVTLAIFLGLLAGAPLSGPMLRRLEKRTVLLIGMGGLTAAQGGPAALRLLGLLPLTGEPLTLALSAVVFVGGALMAAASIAFGSMMADAADEHEFLFRARREGLYFASWSFASKAASGAGALIAGLVLQLIGFPSGAAAAHAVPSPATVAELGAFYGPGAAVVTLLSLLVTARYRLDRAAHAALLAQLEERRSGRAAA